MQDTESSLLIGRLYLEASVIRPEVHYSPGNLVQQRHHGHAGRTLLAHPRAQLLQSQLRTEGQRVWTFLLQHILGCTADICSIKLLKRLLMVDCQYTLRADLYKLVTR